MLPQKAALAPTSNVIPLHRTLPAGGPVTPIRTAEDEELARSILSQWSKRPAVPAPATAHVPPAPAASARPAASVPRAVSPWAYDGGWRVSRNGNPFRNQDGFNIVVFPGGGGWRVRVAHHDISAACVTSPNAYASAAQAKAAAYGAFVYMRDRLRQVVDAADRDDWDR